MCVATTAAPRHAVAADRFVIFRVSTSPRRFRNGSSTRRGNGPRFAPAASSRRASRPVSVDAYVHAIPSPSKPSSASNGVSERARDPRPRSRGRTAPRLRTVPVCADRSISFRDGHAIVLKFAHAARHVTQVRCAVHAASRRQVDRGLGSAYLLLSTSAPSSSAAAAAVLALSIYVLRPENRRPDLPPLRLLRRDRPLQRRLCTKQAGVQFRGQFGGVSVAFFGLRRVATPFPRGRHRSLAKRHALLVSPPGGASP